MRKLVIVLALAATALVGAIAAPHAQAQDYPKVGNKTPFTPEANFMSLPGYLRWQYYLQSGRWISHDTAVQVVKDQGGRV